MFDNKKIYSFADVPHMIKLLRNHFIDSGFVIDGKLVGKEIILKLLDINSTDLKITHKISEANVFVSGPKRQNVKLATKLFSHTVSQAITWAASRGYLHEENWLQCHQLLKIVSFSNYINLEIYISPSFADQRLVRRFQCKGSKS